MSPHLLFHIEGVEVVVISQFSAGRHVLQRVQTNSVDSIDGPAGQETGAA